jgi:hypothetical protein
MRELLPPVSTSVADAVSGSASIVGVPTWAADLISVVGPDFRIPIGLFTKLVRGRGAFCSATIHACDFGSGCGTGTFIATSLVFASGTYFDRG